MGFDCPFGVLFAQRYNTLFALLPGAFGPRHGHLRAPTGKATITRIPPRPLQQNPNSTGLALPPVREGEAHTLIDRVTRAQRAVPTVPKTGPRTVTALR